MFWHTRKGTKKSLAHCSTADRAHAGHEHSDCGNTKKAGAAISQQQIA